MKRRLELARGLTQPQVLFLDEPTGLDPQNRWSIWKYIRQIRGSWG